MKIIKYPDGTSYAQTPESFSDLIAASKFTYKINSYEDLWHLGQILEVFNHRGLEPRVTIPCILEGQADKRFKENESSGLKLVCDFLNQFDAEYSVFHPHNPEVVEALLNNVTIIDNSRFIKEVIWKINGDYPKESLYLNLKKDTLVLMSSDAGGFKPLMKLCDKLNWKGETISASKSRSYNPVTGITDLVQLLSVKDLGGKDVLIVDDLCIYGGTFKGLSKLLKSRNCGKLYLAVSHMTVQNLGEDPVIAYFDKVFTTNSKYNTYHGSDLLEFVDLEIIKIF